MGDRVVYVIGDGLARFAEGRLFMTLSQLYGLLAAGAGALGDRVVVLPGQGLGEDEVVAVLTAAAASPWRAAFDFTEWYHRPLRARLDDAADVLVSAPRRVARDVFVFDLLIDDACALVAIRPDPRRVLLAEAARQSLLAVSAMLLPGSVRPLVKIEETEASADRLALALDARIRCTIHASSGMACTFKSEIAIEQGEARIATFSAVLHAYGADALPAVA